MVKVGLCSPPSTFWSAPALLASLEGNIRSLRSGSVCTRTGGQGMMRYDGVCTSGLWGFFLRGRTLNSCRISGKGLRESGMPRYFSGFIFVKKAFFWACFVWKLEYLDVIYSK